MESPRLPRFQRQPDLGPVRLTNRDRQIVRWLFDHRFLTSRQMADLAGGSRQQLLRRLQLLYHHGYLERPRAQIDYYAQGGSRAMVYGLGNKGAALLKGEEDFPFHRADWSARNGDIKRLFLEHALLVFPTTWWGGRARGKAAENRQLAPLFKMVAASAAREGLLSKNVLADSRR